MDSVLPSPDVESDIAALERRLVSEQSTPERKMTNNVLPRLNISGSEAGPSELPWASKSPIAPLKMLAPPLSAGAQFASASPTNYEFGQAIGSPSVLGDFAFSRTAGRTARKGSEGSVSSPLRAAPTEDEELVKSVESFDRDLDECMSRSRTASLGSMSVQSKGSSGNSHHYSLSAASMTSHEVVTDTEKEQPVLTITKAEAADIEDRIYPTPQQPESSPYIASVPAVLMPHFIAPPLAWDPAAMKQLQPQQQAILRHHHESALAFAHQQYYSYLAGASAHSGLLGILRAAPVATQPSAADASPSIASLADPAAGILGPTALKKPIPAPRRPSKAEHRLSSAALSTISAAQ